MSRRMTAKVLAATMFGTIDSNALVPIIALYAQSVGADLVQTGVIVGLFSLVHAPANVFFGRIADRIGRKLPLQVGLLWDAVSLFLYSIASTPLLLALVRISHGIGSGFVGPSSMALIADTSTPERKGRSMALYGITLVPLHLQQELGYGPLAVGLSFTAFAILSLLLHYPAGILADRFGPSTPAGIGLVAVAIAMASIPLVRDLSMLLALMALFGVGHGFVFPAASTLVSRGADPDQHGVVTGLFYAVLVSGVAVGAPVMAAVASVTTFGGGIWASAWVSLIGLAFLARVLISTETPLVVGSTRLMNGPK